MSRQRPPRRKAIKHTAAVITVSDRAARGERTDTAGPLVASVLEAEGIKVVQTTLVPDNRWAIAEAIKEAADELNVSLVLTTGGTGLAPTDVTPEATLDVAERLVPGLAEAMRQASAEITPHAWLSRAVCAIRGATLIINLPGSPRGAKENLEVILPALSHGLDKLRGDTSDCARP